MLMRPINSRYGEWLIPLLFLVLGLGLFFYPVFQSGFRLVPGYSIDPRLGQYILEHSYRWLIGRPLHADFWSPPMFYPEKLTLGFSDIFVGFAWLYWPFRVMGYSSSSSYAIWLIFIFTINFVLMYVGLRFLLRINVPSSSAGAYVFAFGIPRMAQLAHPQLLSQMYILVMVFGFMLLVKPTAENERRRRWQGWLYLVFGAVLQFYSGFYNVWFAVFSLLVLFITALFISECRQNIMAGVRSPAPLILIPVAVLLAWPLLQVYLKVLEMVGARPLDEIENMLPDVTSWFYVGSFHMLYGRIYSWLPGLIPAEMTHEHVLGFGLVTMVTAWVGLIRWRHEAWPRAVLIMSVVLVALTWNYSEKWNMWFYIAEWVPGASAIRAVSRIILTLMIPLSAGLAYHLHRMKSARWRNVLIGVVLLEQWCWIPIIDPKPTEDRVAEISRQARLINKPFYMSKVVEPGYVRGKELEFQIDAMWAGMEADLPTVNGYSGTVPREWIKLYFNTIEVDRDRMRLADWLEEWMNKHPDITAEPVILETQL